MQDTHYLAHMNTVRPIGPLSADQPHMTFFLNQFFKINSFAHETDGLRWYNHGLRSPDGEYLPLEDLLNLRTEGTEDNPHIMTVGGWKSVKALHTFSYRHKDHAESMRNLRNWVDRSEGPTLVLWWQPRNERVTLQSAWDRLMCLRENGPSAEAFSLQTRFEQPRSPLREAG